MSETGTEDIYHCPECSFEWGGYERPPPYAHCPKCRDGMMRRGPAEMSDETNRDGIDEIATELETVIEDCPHPGATRYLENAREKIVGAQRMYDWEARGQ